MAIHFFDMVFFGQVVDEDGMEVPIPEGHELCLLVACADPYSKKDPPTSTSGNGKRKLTDSQPSPLVLMVKTAEDEEGTILGVVDPGSRVFQCTLGHQFSADDGPVVLWVKGGELHVSGRWVWDEGCDHDGECGDECGDECTVEDEGEEEEAPDLVPLEEEAEAELMETVPAVEEVKAKKAKKEKKVKKVQAPAEPAPEVEVEAEPVAKKAKVAGLKRWRVGVENAEGVVVPEPKTVIKSKDLRISDFIIGSGAEPRPGATVKILYEGYFPDGTLFDAKLKRKSPFVFRKGTGQVIKGMDMGLEGMRIGGARELHVPSALG